MKALYNDGSVAEVESAEEALHIIRHSAAHIMAQAIKRLYPTTASTTMSTWATRPFPRTTCPPSRPR